MLHPVGDNDSNALLHAQPELVANVSGQRVLGEALSEAIHNTMAAPSSQDFMAKLEAVKTPLRTPVKTPLRTDLEEAIFNELMDADHGPHWTSPAKSCLLYTSPSPRD